MLIACIFDFHLVLAQQQRLSPTVLPGDGSNNCPSTDQVDTTQTSIDGQILTLIRNNVVPSIIGTVSYPASSCNLIPQGSPSGNYYIRSNSSDESVLQYCDMTRTSCCSTTGGWMRVANIDMNDPNQQCPSPLTLWTNPHDTSVPGSLRLCDRKSDVAGCVSTIYAINGVQYSRVCGRIHAYQFSITNGFARYNQYDVGIDDILGYMDGISLTHGSPRQHIWTFTAGSHDSPLWPDAKCPCTNSEARVPSFVGNDYFCETGSRNQAVWPEFYPDDPLWDGQGCVSGTSACQCTFSNPPYFCKQLPQPTTDDIEMRVCGDSAGSSEGTPFDTVEIYVQ